MCLVGLLLLWLLLVRLVVLAHRSGTARLGRTSTSTVVITVVIIVIATVARISGTSTSTSSSSSLVMRVIVVVLLWCGIAQPAGTGMEGSRADGIGVAAAAAAASTTGRLTVIFGVACIGVSTGTVLLIVARICVGRAKRRELEMFFSAPKLHKIYAKCFC